MGFIDRLLPEVLAGLFRGMEGSWRRLMEVPWVQGILLRALTSEQFAWFVVTIGEFLILALAIFVVHLAISKRHARVFVSFQHEREGIAHDLAVELTRMGMEPVKLPFVTNPDHDVLLDQVKHAIRNCDVFVCIPGNGPSFVEHEVSMAFGLEKPLLFLLAEADAPHLPNTAKKGYPMFALEKLEHERFRTLVDFCCYLSANRKSTTRMYMAVFERWSALVGSLVLIPICGFGAIVMAWLFGPGTASTDIKFWKSPLQWAESAILDPRSLAVGVIWLSLFTLVYGGFMFGRLRLRNRIRRAISTQKFSDSSLPSRLDAVLTREGLRSVFFSRELVAQHELHLPTLQTAS